MTPAERKALLLEAVRAEPSPVRLTVARRERGSIAMAAGVTLAVFVAIGGPHAVARPPMLVAVTAAFWALVATVATALALFRGRTMLGAPRPWVLAAAITVPVLLAASWFAMPWPLASATHRYGADATCLAFTLAMALAPLVTFLALRREGDPVLPGVTGAVAGAAAGAWGCFLIDLHCETTDARHVVLGHLVPVVMLVLVGALAARSTLRVRGAARR